MEDPGDPIVRSVAKLVPIAQRVSESSGVFSVFCPECQEPTDPHTRTGECMFCGTRLLDAEGNVIIHQSPETMGEVIVLSARMGKTHLQLKLEREQDQEKILEVLAGGPLSRSGIAKKTGLSSPRIYFMCKELRESGQIKMVGTRRVAMYFLADNSAPS